MNDLRKLLENLGFSQYYELFEENDIDLSLVGDLSLDDLKEIGIQSLGHRKKLLSAFKDFAEKPSGSRNDDEPEIQEYLDSGRAERREVTTVFADLTGYTSLSRELDTEDLHDVLSAFFDRFNEIVTRMGGTIERHIGDCVMAVFGAPVSHGNDAERALRTTIELHKAMEEISRRFGRELSVHIGAAAGNVLFSTRGYGQRKDQDFTLTGDTVNLASRLAGQANGKETLVDDQIFRSFSHIIDCDAPSTLEVKGFEVPVLAHRFIGFRELGSQKALVGRESEIGAFREALDRCADSGLGETIYVCADAGMGKSRLLQEVGKEAKLRDFATHSTLVLDFGLGGAQSPINALVSSLCGLGENARRSAIENVATRLIENGTLDDTSALFLNTMLGGEPDRASTVVLDAMSDKARDEGRREALRRLVRHFSSQKPCLLVVEDIHWADSAILPSIKILSEESQTCPVVLAITSRLEGPVAQMDIAPIESSARIRRIDLEALTAEDALQMAQMMVRPTQETVRKCIERAQGNPLFLEQLLRHANDSDGLIPGSIQSLIQARFDRLAQLDRQILQAAAILGQRFSMQAVTQIAGVDVYDERPLVDAALIQSIDDGYLFAHALIRDAVLSTILRNDLRALHRSAAEWFSGRDIFLHAEHLGAAKDPGAAKAYLAAARDARSNYENEGALGFAEKGLECEPEPEVEGPLLRVKGDMLRELGRSAESIEAFETARDLADAPRDICLAQIGIVAAMRILDRIDEAYALLDTAQEVAEGAGLLPELSEIHYFRGSLHFPRGNLDGCLEDHTKSLAYAESAGLPERQARALSGLGDAHYARGKMFTAHTVIEQCLALCDEHGFGAVESSNRFMLATVKIYMNETEQALKEALRSAELAAQVGLNRPEIVSRLTAGWILTSMAQYQEARTEIETGLQLAERLGAKRFEPFLEETLARIELAEGRFGQAASIAEGAKEKLHEVGAESFIGPWVLSTVALTTPDEARRRDVLAEGEALLAKGCVGHNYFRFYRNASQACLNSEKWDEALRYADALAGYTTDEPTPWSDFHVERIRTLVEKRQHGGAEKKLAALRIRAVKAGLHNSIPDIDGKVTRIRLEKTSA